MGMIPFILQTALCVVMTMQALLSIGQAVVIWRLIKITKEGNRR